MNDCYLYLLLNIGTLSIPLLASFYPKANFSKTWKALFPAIIITGSIFIVWDVWFTKIGVWGFNSRYLVGIDLFHLPVEEWLFFFTIPYACVFTYFSLNYLIEKDYFKQYYKKTTVTLIVVLITIGVINIGKMYTSLTFIATAMVLMGHLVFGGERILRRFYLMYLIILIPFFIVNGILTGTGIEGQVVWYNNMENLGIRLGTIPIEDSIYGLLLLLVNVTIYEWLLKKEQTPR